MPRPPTYLALVLAFAVALAASLAWAGESFHATLFFPDASGGLSREPRVLEAGEEPRARALALMEALARGPEREGLLRPLPEGAGVRSLFVLPGGMVVLDLARGPFERAGFGSVRELGCLRAIVFTLARNIPEAASVRVLMDGSETDTLAGHINAGEPLRPQDLFSGEIR